MIDFTLSFILSQILMLFAMGFDFLGMQFNNRKSIYLSFVISASLISAHYFLLGKVAAGIIVFFAVLRFIVCYFSTNKKYLYLFLIINTLVLIFTYVEMYDLIIYAGSCIFMIGNFQANHKLMRRLMMVGTSLIIVYNAIIFSPMGVIVEGNFLLGNIIGYYRHHIRSNSSK